MISHNFASQGVPENTSFYETIS